MKGTTNIMNRNEGAHHLSHVYDPLLATKETSIDWSTNHRDDQMDTNRYSADGQNCQVSCANLIKLILKR